MSLTFSSGNTPTASLKLNNDLPYTTDRSISVQIDSSQEIELMSFALGSTALLGVGQWYSRHRPH
ncbi:hypothetical protein [Bdellovibrio sp.]|uniref:hypothetical protein n=1 Tax=Bdellovibrio sp. TaxID=28201 RepID=UPI0032213A16